MTKYETNEKVKSESSVFSSPHRRIHFSQSDDDAWGDLVLLFRSAVSLLLFFFSARRSLISETLWMTVMQFLVTVATLSSRVVRPVRILVCSLSRWSWKATSFRLWVAWSGMSGCFDRYSRSVLRRGTCLNFCFVKKPRALLSVKVTMWL